MKDFIRKDIRFPLEAYILVDDDGRCWENAIRKAIRKQRSFRNFARFLLTAYPGNPERLGSSTTQLTSLSIAGLWACGNLHYRRRGRRLGRLHGGSTRIPPCVPSSFHENFLNPQLSSIRILRIDWNKRTWLVWHDYRSGTWQFFQHRFLNIIFGWCLHTAVGEPNIGVSGMPKMKSASGIAQINHIYLLSVGIGDGIGEHNEVRGIRYWP